MNLQKKLSLLALSYIENPSFNKEQSQKYAIEILQDFIQNKLQYTSKNGMPTTT